MRHPTTRFAFYKWHQKKDRLWISIGILLLVGLLYVVISYYQRQADEPALVIGADSLSEGHKLRYYWERLDDTLLSHSSESTEKVFIHYAHLLYEVSLSEAQQSINETIDRYVTDSLMLQRILGFAEKYFFDPNSPLQNEVFFEAFLQKALSVPILDSFQRSRYADLLALIKKNSVDTYATNFRFSLADHKDMLLYDIEAEFLILFFGNPECSACKEMVNSMTCSKILPNMLSRNNHSLPILKILHIYADENVDMWREHEPYLPKEWINAYDRSGTIKSKRLYDLKALPTLYLLDRNKRVILKDVPFEVLETYLSQFF